MPHEEFLGEIKEQYTRSLQNRANLDSKANNLTSMSGMIVTLLMGFGIFMMQMLNPDYVFYNLPLIFLVIGIILVIASIVLATLSYRLKTINYPTGPKLFFNKDGKYNEERIMKFIKSEKSDFYERKIKDYLTAIKINNNVNDGKVKRIKISQWLFLFGMGIIPIIVIVLIHAAMTNGLTIEYSSA